MAKQPKYKVYPPMGSIVLKTDVMDEAQLREFAMQITQDDAVWREKMEKDPIADVVESLSRSGYTIEIA